MSKTLLLLFLIPVLTDAQTTSHFSDTLCKRGAVYRTYEIQFEFGITNAFKDESFALLDNLAQFLRENPELVIEVGYHSDTRYKPVYCTNPNYRKAQSVVNYLVSKGVDPLHLISKGYGDSQPIISENEILKMKTKEEQEKAHQMNRRVEFKVIGIINNIGSN